MKIFTQGVLHWVAEPSPGVDPLKVEIRLFDKLFNSEVGSYLLGIWIIFLLSATMYYEYLWLQLFFQNPAEFDNWLADLNSDSKVEIPAAYAVSSLRDAAVGDTFQFERLGRLISLVWFCAF